MKMFHTKEDILLQDEVNVGDERKLFAIAQVARRGASHSWKTGCQVARGPVEGERRREHVTKR